MFFVWMCTLNTRGVTELYGERNNIFNFFKNKDDNEVLENNVDQTMDSKDGNGELENNVDQSIKNKDDNEELEDKDDNE